jgi:hypothetical protein
MVYSIRNDGDILGDVGTERMTVHGDSNKCTRDGMIGRTKHRNLCAVELQSVTSAYTVVDFVYYFPSFSAFTSLITLSAILAPSRPAGIPQ